MGYPLCGHEEIQALLHRAIAQPAAAYGFFGPEHIGKRRLAEAFARELLLHPEPLPLEGHPDFALLDAQEAAGIEELRAFLERAHRTAARGGRRVFLIDHAEGLNTAGYNALLKDVEEPRPGVTFLFVSSQAESLPATLRSRLVPLSVKEVSQEVLATWAQSVLQVPPSWTEEALGRPGLLIRRQEDPAWWEALHQQAVRIQQAYHHPEPGALIAALDDWQKMVEGETYPDQAWRLLILLMARACRGSEVMHQEAFARSLVIAWRSIGGSLPTRVAFEWSRLQTEVNPHAILSLVDDWGS